MLFVLFVYVCYVFVRLLCRWTYEPPIRGTMLAKGSNLRPLAGAFPVILVTASSAVHVMLCASCDTSPLSWSSWMWWVHIDQDAALHFSPLGPLAVTSPTPLAVTSPTSSAARHLILLKLAFLSRCNRSLQPFLWAFEWQPGNEMAVVTWWQLWRELGASMALEIRVYYAQAGKWSYTHRSTHACVGIQGRLLLLIS